MATFKVLTDVYALKFFTESFKIIVNRKLNMPEI
jgi:hypothetical protein